MWNNPIQGLSLSIAPFCSDYTKKMKKKNPKNEKNTKKKTTKQKKGKKQRTVAIDSCRRTSNPYVNFMEKWKGIKCGR